jgi:hypothetical protein
MARSTNTNLVDSKINLLDMLVDSPVRFYSFGEGRLGRISSFQAHWPLKVHLNLRNG